MDRITAVNGEPLMDPNVFSRLVGMTRPGEVIGLEVQRRQADDLPRSSASRCSAARTLVAGIALALACAILISFLIPVDFTSRELMSRAEVRLDGMALAIAAGAAAALSLNRGANATLVGVMVAAALLHDIGHYTNEFPEDALEQGIDNHHDAQRQQHPWQQPIRD